MHKALSFKNEDEQGIEISEDGTFYKRFVGNVTVKTKLTFEYDVKKNV